MKNFTTKLCFIAALFFSTPAFSQVPKLSSYSAAQPTIFLDFDGQTVQTAGWNNGNAFVCASSSMNNTQITEIFNRVSEDYRPFAVNVTTDSAVYLAAPVAQRIRIIVTTSSSWYPGVGGVCYIGAFTWGSETPGFVFVDQLAYTPKFVAEACTHESGHSIGLSHQARFDASCNLIENYNSGNGTGETSWAPVMGVGYYKNMTGWSDGPTPYDCTTLQDNLTIINTGNGITYRTDDFAETMNASTTNLNPVSFSIGGIISTPTDKDAFRLVLPQTGPYHLEANPYSVAAGNDGADVDLMLSLYNSAGTLITIFNPLASMSVSVDTTLNAGTYYIMVSGAGNNNTTNYGSLGSYTFSGFKGALPIHSITLQGANDKDMHRLNWSVIADEPLAAQVLESSANGADFQPLVTTNGTAKSYTYTPAKSGTYFYRLKAISVIDQVMYSNIVSLKATGSGKLFTVSTFVQQSISINATDNYTYNLYDANARMISSGKMAKGPGTVNVQNLPKGMYILQMISDSYKQTERIIKQ